MSPFAIRAQALASKRVPAAHDSLGRGEPAARRRVAVRVACLVPGITGAATFDRPTLAFPGGPIRLRFDDRGDELVVDPMSTVPFAAGERIERTALPVIPGRSGAPDGPRCTRCVLLEFDEADVVEALGTPHMPRRPVPTTARALFLSRQVAGRVAVQADPATDNGGAGTDTDTDASALPEGQGPAVLIDDLPREEMALELLHSTLASFRDERARPSRGVEARQRRLVDAVREHLDDHLAEPVTVSGLAARFDVSRFHLVRMFRRYTGRSLREYILELRLLASLDHVTAYRGELTRLALSLGFYDHSHFTRAFRRLFGVPPSALRAPYLRA